jgi:hypothetical protein
LGDHGWLVGAAAAGQHPVDLLDGQQVDPQGPDASHDGVQVDLVGLFPAGAGDVPGPNALAWHRGSMAERLPLGQPRVPRSWLRRSVAYGQGKDGQAS